MKRKAMMQLCIDILLLHNEKIDEFTKILGGFYVLSHKLNDWANKTSIRG